MASWAREDGASIVFYFESSHEDEWQVKMKELEIQTEEERWGKSL